MIENYRSGFLWALLKKCSYLTTGLRRAGFTGGWLDAAPETPEEGLLANGSAHIASGATPGELGVLQGVPEPAR